MKNKICNQRAHTVNQWEIWETHYGSSREKSPFLEILEIIINSLIALEDARGPILRMAMAPIKKALYSGAPIY